MLSFITWSEKDLTNLIILDTMNLYKRFLRWLPALAVMLVIFGFSSIPSREMPSFGLLDLVVKKGSHMLGYGLLVLACWYGLRFEKRLWWLALVMVVLYAMTDEFHQSFVPGRHPSWVDVLGFDGGGAALALLIFYWVRKRMRW
jgi:VanZ family protein